MTATVDRRYMIYRRDGRYLVCDEAFGNYVKPDEVVRRGIRGCLDAEIEAGRIRLRELNMI